MCPAGGSANRGQFGNRLKTENMISDLLSIYSRASACAQGNVGVSAVWEQGIPVKPLQAV